MNAVRKPITLKYGNFSYGMRLSASQTRLYEKEVNFAQDCILQDNGCFFMPGHYDCGIEFTAKVSGVHIFKTFDDSEVLLAVSGGKLYSINLLLKTKTELFNIGSTANAYFTDYLGKCWVTASGGTPCKVEYNLTTKAVTASKIGIAKPTGTGTTLGKSAGGTLPDGVYNVYIAYGRIYDGSIVLYSDSLNLNNITLGGGDNTINITGFGNSTDTQVNDKIIFATDAGGDTAYYLHHTNDNTTTSITIASLANQDKEILMQSVSVDNYPMPSCEFIYAFNGRLWGSVKNDLYYSLQNINNVWDLERFKLINKTSYPHIINGIYGLREDLFLSTKTGGMIKQPQANPDTQLSIVDSKYYFYEMNTVAPDQGVLWGLTNDGVRYFDGERFSSENWSVMVHSEIRKIYSSSSGHSPCGFIKVRHKVLSDDQSVITQKEYHLSYCDDVYTINHNNKRLVLDLESFINPQRNEDAPADQPRHQYIAKWVMWNIGFNYATANKTEIPYLLQQSLTAPLLMTENNDDLKTNVYLYNGTKGTDTTYPNLRIVTKATLTGLTDKLIIKTLLAYVKTPESFKISITSMDSDTIAEQSLVGDTAVSGTPFSWDTDGAGWDEGYWIAEKRQIRKAYVGLNSLSSAMYLIIEANNGNPNFNIEKIELLGFLIKHRLVR